MKGTVKKQFKKMVFVVLCFAVLGSLSRPLPVTFANVNPDILQAALNDNLKAETVLQNEIRARYRLISRPNSEYLLYQKSLGLEEASADLRQLRFERAALIQELTSTGSTEALPMLSGLNVGPISAASIATAYSGAPMLSFDDGSRHSPRPISERAGFYRILTATFLAIAFSLPLLAIYKKKTEVPAGKNLVRVFPIFSRWEKNGERALFKLPANRHETLHPKFGA